MRIFTLRPNPMSRLMGATILVLAVFFLLYFFVYVQHRREYLHEKAFRVLNQAGDNLNDKYQTFITNARREISYRRAMDASETDHQALSIDSLGRSIVKKGPAPKDTTREWNMPLPARYNQLLEFTDVKLLVKKRDSVKYVEPAHSGRIEVIQSGKAGPVIPLSARLDTSNGQYLHFEDTVRVVQVDGAKVTPGNTLRIAFRVKLEEFMRDAITGQEDLFDGYQLFRERSVAFTTVPGGLAINGGDTVISSIINAGGKRTKTGYSHATSRVLDVEIAGRPYKLFLQRVQIGQVGEGMALGLLMSNGNYRDHIYEVPMSTILLCSLLMLVLMLGFPFIKLRLIGNGERLKTEDAFFCAVSIAISFFLVTLIALSYYVYRVPEDHVNRVHLRHLADSVKANFVQELKDIRGQLAQYDPARFGEIQQLQQPSKGDGPVSILARDSAKLTYPNRYPYFDMVFWIDENGNAFEQLHTGKVLQPYVNVKDRNYFRDVVEGRPWNLDSSGKHQDSTLFTIQPVFNRITGENMAVVAVPYHKTKPVIRPEDYRPVLAADVRMHSVIRPVVPLGYGFCIMDRDGLIWFHSDHRKNLQEYFPRECSGAGELLSALRGNVSRHLRLTYNGQHYSAYGTPLPQMPLYLVVFHQESYFNSIRTLSTSVTIIHYLLALLPLCLLLLVHKATCHYDARLGGENFAFRWLAPNHGKERQYRLLCPLLYALIALEVLMLFARRNERDLWAFYVLVIITSLAAARTLLYNDINLSGMRFWSFWATYFCLAGLLLFCITRQWFGNPLDGGPSPVMQWGVLAGELLLTLILTAGLVGLFAGLRLVALRWFREPAGPARPASRTLYPRLLVAWVILLSILPALAFYRTNYLREHRIAASHGLIQAARDLTERQLRVQAQYRDTEARDKEGLQNALIQEHGCYVKAVNSNHVAFSLPESLGSNKPDNLGSKEPDNRFVDLLPVMRLRPLYNRMAVENNLLLKTDPAGNHWRWTAGLSPDSLQLQFFEYDLSKPRQNYLTLSAVIPAYAFGYIFRDNEGWRIILLVAMGVSIVAGLVALIHFTVRHLFNFGIHETTQSPYFPVPRPLAETWTEVRKHKQRVLLTGAYLPDRRLLEGYFLGANPAGKGALQGVAIIDLMEVTEGKALPPLGSPGEPAAPAPEAVPIPVQVQSGRQAHTEVATAPAVLAFVDTKKMAEELAAAPCHLILTHFEQLAAWAGNHPKFSAQSRHLCGLIEEAQSVMILSVEEPNDVKEKVGRLIENAAGAPPAGDDAGKRAERQSRLSELLRWQHLIGGFEARYFSLEAFTGPGPGADPAATDDVRPKGAATPAGGNRPENHLSETRATAEVEPAAAVNRTGAGSGPETVKDADGNARAGAPAGPPTWRDDAGALWGRFQAWRRRYSRSAYAWEVGQAAACRRERWNQLVAEECGGHGPFLRGIEPDIRTIVEGYAQDPTHPAGQYKRRGDVILKIQDRARFHYNALWESCTREEQYILYDLAQDGLVDCRNMPSLRSLLQKGLVTYDGSVKLMNRSFRNYILHAIEPRYGSEIEAEIRQKSSWNEYRSVLALVIGAVITFIFLTQRETYNQIHAVITTLTASIPLILNLIGTMSFGGSKSGGQ